MSSKKYGTTTIKTERLVLRKILPTDFFSVKKWYSDPKIARFSMSRKPPDTWAIFRFTVGRIRHYRNKDYYIWAIVYDGKMRGFIELLPVKSVRKIYSFSYKLDMSLKNMGIMTEAVKAVIEYMKTQDVYGLSATCDVENIGSERVMQKAGMQKRELSPENQTIKYEDGTEGKRAYYRIKLQ